MFMIVSVGSLSRVFTMWSGSIPRSLSFGAKPVSVNRLYGMLSCFRSVQSSYTFFAGPLPPVSEQSISIGFIIIA